MRVVVLSSASLDPFERAVLETLAGEDSIALSGAVIDTRPQDSVRSRLRHELSRGRGGYVGVMIASAAWRRVTEPLYSAQEWFGAHNVPTLSVVDLYSDSALEFITRHQPDCLFRNGFGIIREPILSIAPRGVLSYHHGDIRRYRGSPYGFWELLHEERSMGATVQVLSPQLDAGRIVVERAIPIRPDGTCHGLRKRARALSIPLAREACLRIADPAFRPLALSGDELGPVYTLPNLRTWLRLQVALLGRRLRAARERAQPRTAAPLAEERTTSAVAGSAPKRSGRALRDFGRPTSQLAMSDLRAFVDSWLARNPARPRVLDAGCGSQMYFYLPPEAHVVGVDIDAEQLRKNPSIDEKIVGDVQTYPFPAASFDLVICYEVLEHVRWPELALENLSRAVAPGGLLVLGGPNLLSLKGLVTRLTPHWFHRIYYRRGGSGAEPFRTYLRRATTPAKIAQWARESSLATEYAAVVESPLQVKAREKVRLTGWLWAMIQRFVSDVTLGFIDLSATDFAIALSKPE